jgi:hypothetical protein
VTGPGALKEAWYHFTYQYKASNQTTQVEDGDKEESENQEEEGEEGEHHLPETQDEESGLEDDATQPQHRRLDELTKSKLNITEIESIPIGMPNGDQSQVKNRTLPEDDVLKTKSNKRKTKGVTDGVYVGMLGRSITVAGTNKVSWM